jgi:hypothetical protein
MDPFARAATCVRGRDRAGAYSPSHHEASIAERRTVEELFGALGEYEVAKLALHEAPGCPTCGWNAHLFSSWFFGVAWDWCYVVLCGGRARRRWSA